MNTRPIRLVISTSNIASHVGLVVEAGLAQVVAGECRIAVYQVAGVAHAVWPHGLDDAPETVSGRYVELAAR